MTAPLSFRPANPRAVPSAFKRKISDILLILSSRSVGSLGRPRVIRAASLGKIFLFVMTRNSRGRPATRSWYCPPPSHPALWDASCVLFPRGLGYCWPVSGSPHRSCAGGTECVRVHVRVRFLSSHEPRYSGSRVGNSFEKN